MKPLSLPVSCVWLIMLVASGGAVAKGYATLYRFCAQQECSDGDYPVGGLVFDGAGNLYGTTEYGGTNDGGICGPGCGTAFTLAPNGSETVLHAFAGGSDGAWPTYGRLTKDKAGNIYGMDQIGGGTGCGGVGCGAIFRVKPNGATAVRYAFLGGSDGAAPQAGVIDDNGNLYGTTEFGGADGKGTVFELTRDGVETVLYSFVGGNDGAGPFGGLIRDKAGNIYGTTDKGGSADMGTVFKLAPTGKETVLYSFCAAQGCVDGSYPVGGLVEDADGNFYGTTQAGGYNVDANVAGSGTIFELTANGTETVLYAFAGGGAGLPDGGSPSYGGLIRDKARNLYGTTNYGGGSGCGGYGCGTVFRLTAGGTETVLHAFRGGRDGAFPQSPLILDSAGLLYGATTEGGGYGCNSAGCGTVFMLQK